MKSLNWLLYQVHRWVGLVLGLFMFFGSLRAWSLCIRPLRPKAVVNNLPMLKP